MAVMFEFTRAMLRMPLHWVLWVGLLMVVNLGGGALHLGTLEGRVVVATFVVAAMLLMALYRAQGFTRLLGLGHFVWFPLVAWLLVQVRAAEPGSTFSLWMWAVIALDSLSLLIDSVDVLRYLRGERAPTVS